MDTEYEKTKKAEDSSALLTVHNLYKNFKKFSLKPVSFSLQPGYILGIIGENGAGKTTLLNLILGGYSIPNDAEIIVDGYLMRQERMQAKERIAYVLNDCPFAMGMTVEENAKVFGSSYSTFSMERFRQQCERYGISLTATLAHLSKGERIQFQLAFAFSYEAKLYIMDEPAGNLDIIARQELLDTMQEIVESGEKSVIYVTHLTEDLDQIGDYILWLENGNLRVYGNKEDILDNYLILQASVRQLDYIAQRNPNRRMVRNIRTNVSEALVEVGSQPLPLNVDYRRPTLEELMYYDDRCREKHNHSIFDSFRMNDESSGKKSAAHTWKKYDDNNWKSSSFPSEKKERKASAVEETFHDEVGPYRK